MIQFVIAGLFVIGFYNLSKDELKTDSVIKPDHKIELKIQKLIEQMTLEQKVAQMIQAEIKSVTPNDIKSYQLGSILNGGGSFPNNDKKAKVSDWVSVADSYFIESKKYGASIPIIWGTDAVHGHNNVHGATLFPHNIGLGAANNAQLIERIGKATAKEVLATGIDWVFAPTVAVVRNNRWGRTYEGYSESPDIIKDYANSMVAGLQGRGDEILSDGHVIATAKHFIGDGGTLNGVDQGDTVLSENDLLTIHAQGYLSAINAGVQTVMASFNSWNGQKLHGHKYLLTEVLKKKMNFDGFVIGDWNGHGQVDGCTNDSCAKAINAGVDMLMAPEDWKKLHKNTLEQVRSGIIKLSRIDDAVSRILRVKIRAGLFENVLPSKRPFAGDSKIIGSKKHREIARQAVRESLVLLKNNKNILPLSRKSRTLVIGSGADNIGKQSGGWSVSWQGTGNLNSDFPGGTSIYDAIKKINKNAYLSDLNNIKKNTDVAIVVFGEEPYAEGQGDIKDLNYGMRFKKDILTLQKLNSLKIPTVSIFLTGRPLWINPELNSSDAFVVAWLPGTEGDGVADVIFKDSGNQVNFDFKGRLSYSWPRFANQEFKDRENSLFPYGYGLDYSHRFESHKPYSESPYNSSEINDNPKEIEIFMGRTMSPLESFIKSGTSELQKLSSLIGESTDKNLFIKAIDKDLQEDARLIESRDTSNKVISFDSPTGLDLSGKNAFLSFEVKRESSISSFVVTLGSFKKDMTGSINNLALNNWTLIKIPLHCFSSKPQKLAEIRKVFQVDISGEAKFSFANAKINFDAPLIGCP